MKSYKLIAVRTNVYHRRIALSPECLQCSDVDTVLRAFLFTVLKQNFFY